MDIFLRKSLKNMKFLHNSSFSFSFLRSSPFSHFFQNKPEIFRKESLSPDHSDSEDRLDPDFQWFSRIQAEVHRNLEICEKSEKNSYEKTLRKSSELGFDVKNMEKTVNLLLYIGISSQRRFFFQRSQRFMMGYLEKLKKTPEFADFLDVFLAKNRFFADFSTKDAEFLRKTWPNLIISCNNLQILDTDLLMKFVGIFHVFKKEITEISFFSPHTILALSWAVMNYENSQKTEISQFLTDLLDYLWLNFSKFDRITLLRFLWISSFYQRFEENREKILWTKFMEEFEKKSYFSYNYKNCNNLLQVLLNKFPEITGDFFAENMEFCEEKCLKSAENNKLKDFLPDFVRICYKAYLVSKSNESGERKIAMLGSNRKELPSFIVIKPNISNKSTIFEDNVCRTLEELEVKYRRNVRIGIYEVDILIETDMALEINGDMHSLYAVGGERYKRNMRFNMKMK